MKRIVPIKLVSLICSPTCISTLYRPGSRQPTGGQFEIAAVILQGGGMASSLTIVPGRYCPPVRHTTAGHEPLIVLMKQEHDKNSRDVRKEPLGGFNRHDFVRTLKTQPLLKIFRQSDGTKHTLRWRIEIVDLRVLYAILKF